MKRHVILGRYGLTDNVPILTAPDENITQLDLLTSEGKLNYGMGNAITDLVKLGIFPTDIGVDLLVFATHVQAADILISRNTDSQDSWTREIRLIVPVEDVEKWNKAAETLKRMLNFLTGDLWILSFRSRPDNIASLVPSDTPPLAGIPFDSISLFSGGLDSLIGAIDLLQNGNTPLLISHASEGSVSDAQGVCFDGLKSHYVDNQFNRLRVWLSFSGLRIDDKEHEKTTRGRSFLFFTLGVLAGTGFNSHFLLKVPENGLIALNIPLDQLRLGSHSTRTTHPFYIAKWNELLSILQIDGVIENPYWNRTKGEMIQACRNKELLKHLLPSSLSCSSPSKGRYRGISVQHCGYCLPCLIRRAAIQKGFGSNEDTTTYTVSDLRVQPLSTLRAEGQQVRSFQLAVRRLNSNPDLAKILILSTGSLAKESSQRVQDLADVYKRGMDEVAAIVNDVEARPV